MESGNNTRPNTGWWRRIVAVLAVGASALVLASCEREQGCANYGTKEVDIRQEGLAQSVSSIPGLHQGNCAEAVARWLQNQRNNDPDRHIFNVPVAVGTGQNSGS